MASFQAEIGLNRMRKRENKNYRFVPILPDALQKFPKKQQKTSKNSKRQKPLWLHFKSKSVERG